MISNCENARNQYLTDNPDVKNANLDPLTHYINNGIKEGRKWKNESCSQPLSVYSNISHKATGKCLDGNGSGVYFGGCQSGIDSQNWKPVPAQAGYFNLTHKATGGCLDGNGTSVYFGGCQTGNDYQNWKLIPAQNGYYNYQHKATGKCLDGNGSALYFGGCQSGNDYQNYSAAPLSPPAPALESCENVRNQYLTDNPDVKNTDPLVHYITYGMNEGRKWKNELCSQPPPAPAPTPAPEPTKPEPVEQIFIINDDKLNDDRQTIITDLYTSIIYLHRFSKTQMNGGHIKIPYFMPSGILRPNVTYMENVDIKKYKCKNLYIFKATHKINMDASFDAELVIELVPVVNTSEKLYLCFLLSNTRYIDRKPNGIDKLLSTSIKPPIHYSTMNLELQKLIEPKQKKIIYKSGIDTVVIFTIPIQINEVDFSGYDQISSRHFAMYPVNNDYKIILPPKEGFTGSIKEGLAIDDTGAIDAEIINLFNSKLITCSPVDDNDQSTVKQNTATYLVDGKKDAQTAQTALGTAFIILLVAIGTSYLGAPLIYKYTIANLITTDTGLTLFTIIITFMMFLLGIILLIGGNQYDSNEMWVGVFIIIFIALSSMSIALSRYSNTSGGTELATFSDTMNAIKDIVPEFLMSFLYTKSDKSAFDHRVVWGSLAGYIVLLIILSIVTGTLDSYPSVRANEKKTKGYIAHLQSLIFSVGFIYGLIFLIWIVMAFKYSQ